MNLVGVNSKFKSTKFHDSTDDWIHWLHSKTRRTFCGMQYLFPHPPATVNITN